MRPSSLVLAQGFFPSKKVFPCDGFVGYSSFPLVQPASKLEAWATHLGKIYGHFFEDVQLFILLPLV